MALKLPNLFGNDRKKPSDADLDMPTTQVKMNQAAQQGYDPLATVSIMDQLRSAGAVTAMPNKVWGIGGLPVTKQFQVLGLRNIVELAPAAPPHDVPAWYAQRWMDGDGNAWQEIDLAKLAQDPAFLQVGI